MADKTPIDYVGGPVGAVSSHGEAGVGEVLNPAASPNKADLRTLAEAACITHSTFEENAKAQGGFIEAIDASTILSLLDELDAKDNTLLALTTRHFAESWSRHSTDAKLDEYLSAGIAQLQEERDAALAELEACRKDARRWWCVRNAVQLQSPYAVWREGSHPVLGKDADELVDNFLAQVKEAPNA